MTSEHTPGPWTARTLDLGPRKRYEIVPLYNDSDRRSVATVTPVAGTPAMDTTANARLIAAAPEMLAALRICYEAHGGRLSQGNRCADAAHELLRRIDGVRMNAADRNATILRAIERISIPERWARRFRSHRFRQSECRNGADAQR